ncbi:MAG: SdiA-regulated domain-containing protein [Bacteroidota bacterium]
MIHISISLLILFLGSIVCYIYFSQGVMFSKTSIAPLVLDTPVSSETVRYDFKTPVVFTLNNKLKEISGLSYNKASNTIYTHNDEKGNIYEVDIDKGEIQNKFKFGPSRDYEGIAVVQDETVLVENRGDLHFYDNEKGTTVIMNTPLSTKQNVEGLCFDEDGALLLLACKGKILNKAKGESKKAIYAYDLSTKQLLQEPYLLIDIKELLSTLKLRVPEIKKEDFKKYKSRLKHFSPSGIALHPKSKDTYIISAKGSLLLVFNKNLEFTRLVFLDEKQIPQPEGICFDDQQSLYIATEGKTHRGKIFKYFFANNLY